MSVVVHKFYDLIDILLYIKVFTPQSRTFEQKGVGAGFHESLCRGKGFAGRFSSYLIAIYLLLICNLIFAVFTVGSFLIISIPASHLFLLSLQFVHYYEDTGKKYFLSFRKISGADGKPEGMGN